MTDKELLQLAAQAAGIELTDFHGVLVRPDVEAGCPPWNPLDDDGDALRLACDLGLVIDCSRPSAGLPFYSHLCRELDAASTAQGARRAIVRAAAAIQIAKVPA